MRPWKILICCVTGHTPARPFPTERPHAEYTDIVGATVVSEELCQRCGLVYWLPGPHAWGNQQAHREAVIQATLSDAIPPLFPRPGDPN